MNVGVLVPVGAIDRFGYQHNVATVVQSACEFGDQVLMCSTSRNRTGVNELLENHSNLAYEAPEDSLFPVDERGEEVFDLDCLLRRSTAGLKILREMGADVCVLLQVNHYIPRSAQSSLRDRCVALLLEGKKWSWLYRRYQIADSLTRPNIRVPWIFNLRDAPDLDVLPGAVAEGGEALARIEIGDFRDRVDEAIVDFPFEQTIDDLREVRNFVRCYHGLESTFHSPVFNWEEHLAVYSKKFSQKRMSNDALDPIGQLVRDRAPNSTVSDFVLEEIRSGAHRSSRLKHMAVTVWRAFRPTKTAK